MSTHTDPLEIPTALHKVKRTGKPSNGEAVERNQAMREARVAGATLAQIGEAAGITRERVRQIVAKEHT
ncbi:MAG: sigma factor-like helix-turn-helix DNA-binding protein [Mycobacterium sp.]